MLISSLILTSLVSGVPAGKAKNGGGGGSGNVNVAVLDPSVSDAIKSSIVCKMDDYIISTCGLQNSSKRQGVTFCFNSQLYLKLCPLVDYPACNSALDGVDIRTVSYTQYCSRITPYYGFFPVII